MNDDEGSSGGGAQVKMGLGDWVILDVNGDHQTVTKLRKGGTYRVSRENVSTDPLIGAPYGSLFELLPRGKELLKRKRVCETADQDWSGVVEIDRNNSRLEDAGLHNQVLTAADIGRLKAEGKSGDEIIHALTQNSATFQSKTQYSQAKYLKKKAAKYLTKVSAIRPTGMALAELYFHEKPFRTAFIRPDSLAILLTLANIGAGGRALTIDCAGGLVTGSVMERMGGIGSVVSGYAGNKKPPEDIMKMMNFNEDQRKSLVSASLAELQGILEGTAPSIADTGAPETRAAEEVGSEDIAREAKRLKSGPGLEIASTIEASSAPLPVNGSVAASNENGLHGNGVAKMEGVEEITAEEAAVRAERHERWLRNQAERAERLTSLCRQGFQSCIIASPEYCPSALMRAAMPLLAPSASFAVFHTFMQPLAECMRGLQEKRSAVAMELQESWLREYQVLPGRTHPTMQTSGSGGYILSGIKVLQPDHVQTQPEAL